MAEIISSLAGSAAALQTLAVALDEGAREGVSRNMALRTLALENRAGLDASAESLTSLAGDVHASAFTLCFGVACASFVLACLTTETRCRNVWTQARAHA